MYDNNIKIKHKIKFLRKTVQKISLKFLYYKFRLKFKKYTSYYTRNTVIT